MGWYRLEEEEEEKKKKMDDDSWRGVLNCRKNGWQIIFLNRPEVRAAEAGWSHSSLSLVKAADCHSSDT